MTFNVYNIPARTMGERKREEALLLREFQLMAKIEKLRHELELVQMVRLQEYNKKYELIEEI